MSLPGTVWVFRQLHTASGAHFTGGTSASTRSMGRTPSLDRLARVVRLSEVPELLAQFDSDKNPGIDPTRVGAGTRFTLRRTCT